MKKSLLIICASVDSTLVAKGKFMFKGQPEHAMGASL